MPERYRRRSPSPGDSPRRRGRSPSPSSSVLQPLHWPRDASPKILARKPTSTIEAPSGRASSHHPPRERTRRRLPSPPFRTRLDSPRTAAHTRQSEHRSHDLDDYDPPVRRRRSYSPRPPPANSRRRSSRSRSPRRRAPRDARALDERDYYDNVGRVEDRAPLSGWEAAYEGIGRRRAQQPAGESGSRSSRGGQVGARGGAARYEDWDAPSGEGGAGTGRLGYEEEQRSTRTDDWGTERSSRFAATQDPTRSARSRPRAADPLPRPPPHRTSRHLEHPHQQSFQSGLVGPSYIEFSASPSPCAARSLSRSPALSPGLSRSPRAGPLALSPILAPSPRAHPLPSPAHPVWLGPLPADLHPDEVVALLAPYAHADFHLHLAETGDGDDAFALEVSCEGREAARTLVEAARKGRVEMRGGKVELLQEDVTAGLEDEHGREAEEVLDGGGVVEEREAVEAKGSVRLEGGLAAVDEEHEGQDYLSSGEFPPVFSSSTH
ncbi:hypothetical protein JCM8208_005842 [Rhodotorula glutinis]